MPATQHMADSPAAGTPCSLGFQVAIPVGLTHYRRHLIQLFCSLHGESPAGLRLYNHSNCQIPPSSFGDME